MATYAKIDRLGVVLAVLSWDGAPESAPNVSAGDGTTHSLIEVSDPVPEVGWTFDGSKFNP